MSFQVLSDFSGIDRAVKVFRRLDRAGKDTRALADAMGQEVAQSAIHRLTVTNTSPDGEKWPTSARVRVKGGLVQNESGTAGLAGSITHRVVPGGFVVGSVSPYAAMRQFGGTIRPRNAKVLIFQTFDERTGEEITIATKKVTQPARPYLGLSDDDVEVLGDLAADHFADVMGEGAP